MTKKMALGKGMASLIQHRPTELLNPSPVANETGEGGGLGPPPTPPLSIPIEDIHPNPNQPRKTFKKDELEELSLSIKESGILVPLIVSRDEEGYQLIAGERRLRAAERAGLREVPVLVKTVTEREKMVISIVENIQRSGLNCVEEALAYSTLMDEFHLTQEEVAKSVGKERSSVANFLRILNLPRPVIDLIREGELSFGHAKVLASVKDRDLAISMAQEVVAKKFNVRELEALVKSVDRRGGEGSGRAKRHGPDPSFMEQLDQCRRKLEQKTGFHIALRPGRGQSGQMTLKFSSEREFNDIYEFFMER